MDTISINKIILKQCNVTINLSRRPNLKIKKKNKKNKCNYEKDNEKKNINLVINECKSTNEYDKYYKNKEPVKDVNYDYIIEKNEVENYLNEQGSTTKIKPELSINTNIDGNKVEKEEEEEDDDEEEDGDDEEEDDDDDDEE